MKTLGTPITDWLEKYGDAEMTSATVRNLLTNEEALYVNSLSPVQTMVSFILCKRNQTGQLLNNEARKKIIEEYGLIERISKNGDKICFCEELNLFCRKNKTL